MIATNADNPVSARGAKAGIIVRSPNGATMKPEDKLAAEGFNEKMISTAKRVAEASSHGTLRKWTNWYLKQSPDAQLDIELVILELTFTFKYRKQQRRERSERP